MPQHQIVHTTLKRPEKKLRAEKQEMVSTNFSTTMWCAYGLVPTIFRWRKRYNLVSTLCLTQCDIPPLPTFEKSWLRPCKEIGSKCEQENNYNNKFKYR